MKHLIIADVADALKIEPAYVAPFIAGPVLILMVFWVVLMTSGRKKKR